MSSRASLNHVYRTVWNQALGCTVAIAENASSQRGVGGAPSVACGGAFVSHTRLLQLGSLSLAVALGWGWVPHAQANPVGGVAIVGQATFDASQPNKLLVTTQNGAGTNYSAINWQSFSIPAGSATRIEQPHAASTSINRVVTNTPSVLFGTLSSNGKVVLVNQSGIAVGAGALVDTAGFTASAVGMTEADALAGRLRFAGDRSVSGSDGTLSVQGKLIARGGDVVLIAPSIELAKTAVVESLGGSVVLAAGQSVEITGRGLEGITMMVQAPQDQAVNLGTLKGDAVGIFAGSLKHSGVIQATQARVDGGRVVLKAAGDTLVEGTGQILASGSGGKGGRVEVLGNRVALMDGAQIDASGAAGGGTVLIGGDAHGANRAIQNAQKAFVAAGVVIKADALDAGDGGKVVVWSDDATQFSGNISAKGGAQSGDGGWVETSGKKNLGFAGRVDTAAAHGATGTLLLDPSDITIGVSATSNMTLASQTYAGTSSPPNYLSTTDLVAALTTSNITVTTASAGGATGNITVSDPFSWASGNTLKLVADNAINIYANITGTGFIGLKAGAGGISNATTSASTTASQLEIISGGPVSLTGTSAIKVDTVAASVTGSLTLEGSAPNSGLTIGTVGSTSGLAASGNVTLYEYGAGKNLLVNANVSSGGTILMSGGSGTATLASGKTISGVATQLFAQGAVTVNGTLSGSTSVNLHSSGSSISTGGTGAVSAPTITLQNDPGSPGAIGSSGTPLKISGATVYIGAASYGPSAVYLSSSGNVNLQSSYVQGSAPISILASGNISLFTPVSSGASGNAIVLAASGNFNDGGNDLSAANGRWLIYSTKPSLNTLNASTSGGAKVSYAFQQYGATYGSGVQGTGNGMLYSWSPTLTASTSTTPSKVYDGTTASNLNAASLSMGGAVISNLLTGVGTDVLTLGGTAPFDTKDVGVNKPVSFSGFSLSAVDSASKPVYGYVLSGGTTGAITQRPLSTWMGTGAFSNQWSLPLNWDAIPDGVNVAAVSIPAGAGTIVFDASIGPTTLKSLISASPILVSGGSLQISNSLSAAGFTQTGGTVSGAGSFKINGAFNQTGGSVAMSTIDVLQAGGNLVFSNLKAPNVSLVVSNGSIMEAGEVVADALVTSSSGGTVLNGSGNRIGAFKANNTGSGAIELTNTGALNIQGISNTGGNIVVSNTGGITTIGPVSAPGGKVSLTANSPLTIGSGGVSSSGNIDLNATNLTSSGNMTLNGSINSSAGSVALNAANNLTQNGSVFGALGVTANVGGVLTLSSSAVSGNSPVNYSVGGRAVTAPPGTTTPAPTPAPLPAPVPTPPTGSFDPLRDAVTQTNLVTTFLDKFEIALQTQHDGPRDKDRRRNDLVVEGELCRP